jgi:hypothetical protein
MLAQHEWPVLLCVLLEVLLLLVLLSDASRSTSSQTHMPHARASSAAKHANLLLPALCSAAGAGAAV